MSTEPRDHDKAAAQAPAEVHDPRHEEDASASAYTPATVRRRAEAVIVDAVLIAVSSLVGLGLYVLIGNPARLLVPILLACALTVLRVLVLASTGMTPGGHLAKVRFIEARSGQRPGLSQLIHADLVLLAVVPTLGLGSFALLGSALRDPNGRGWHDRFSGVMAISSTQGATEAQTEGRGSSGTISTRAAGTVEEVDVQAEARPSRPAPAAPARPAAQAPRVKAPERPTFHRVDKEAGAQTVIPEFVPAHAPAEPVAAPVPALTSVPRSAPSPSDDEAHVPMLRAVFQRRAAERAAQRAAQEQAAPVPADHTIAPEEGPVLVPDGSSLEEVLAAEMAAEAAAQSREAEALELAQIAQAAHADAEAGKMLSDTGDPVPVVIRDGDSLEAVLAREMAAEALAEAGAQGREPSVPAEPSEAAPAPAGPAVDVQAAAVQKAGAEEHQAPQVVAPPAPATPTATVPAAPEAPAAPAAAAPATPAAPAAAVAAPAAPAAAPATQQATTPAPTRRPARLAPARAAQGGRRASLARPTATRPVSAPTPEPTTVSAPTPEPAAPLGPVTYLVPVTAGERITVSGPTVVGRNPANTSVYPEARLVALGDAQPSVSGTHAVLLPTPAGLMVTDLGSTNGTRWQRSTRVRTLPAQAAVPVKAGSVLFLGSVAYRVEL